MSGERHKWICAELARPVFRLGVGLTIGFASVLFTSGCASTSASKRAADEQRVRRLEQDLRKTKNQLQEVKERNLVLERRLNKNRRAQETMEARAPSVPVPFHPSAALEPSVEVSTASPLVLPVAIPVAIPAALPAAKSKTEAAAIPGIGTPVLEQVGTAQTGEHFLYSKILETYRQKKTAEMHKSLQMFLKTYPDSVFADNGLYLAGLLALESNDNKRAGDFMDRVLKSYPKGNKAVSALFAKAIIEKRKKNYDEAKRLFEKVQRTFPGSPESKRVTVELKLLQIAAGGRRES